MIVGVSVAGKVSGLTGVGVRVRVGAGVGLKVGLSVGLGGAGLRAAV